MSEFSMFEIKYLAVYLLLWQLIRKSWRAQNTLNKILSFPKCVLVRVKAPCILSFRLKISQILGILKTEDLKIQFWVFEDLKTAYTRSSFTQDIFCLRLKIWRQHILYLKICCAGGLRVHSRKRSFLFNVFWARQNFRIMPLHQFTHAVFEWQNTQTIQESWRKT